MTDIFTTYDIKTIFGVLIFVLIGIRGVVDFFEWVTNHFIRTVNKFNEKTNQKEQVKDNSEDITELRASIKQINDTLTLLLESDRADIKYFITSKHNYYCYVAKWIDEYSLECLERRYQYYKAEGGNSFIDEFMQEIRALPKTPPET